MLIYEFGVQYGFYDKDFLETERYQTSTFQFHETKLFLEQFWQHLAPHSYEHYKPKSSKSTKIENLALRYLHKFITYSLCGGGDSNEEVTL